MQAWQVEEGDVITLGGDVAFTVWQYLDTGAGVSMILRDDDGEASEPFYFTPFDPIQLVVSLDDPVPDEVDSEV